MSGKFVPLFLWTIIISSLIFLLLLAVLNYATDTDWSHGKAFIQMTNPSPNIPEAKSISEWIAIIVMNLFGLFVLNGVILTLLVNWVSNRKDRHEKGKARYEYIFEKRFTAIIGGHRIVAGLARDLITNGNNDYILIQTQRNPEILRKEIAAEITDESIASKIIIYAGDRVSKHEIEELRLNLAQEVYIVGEPASIDTSSHDAINMETWQLMNQLYQTGNPKRIPCHVMFEYQSTFSAFQFTDMKLERSRAFRFIPFSLYESWAQQLLLSKTVNNTPYYLPLDSLSGLSYSAQQRVHLVIVGMSKMGIALAVEAAHTAHYPNFNNSAIGRPRTLITFIDRNAKREMTFFMGRFRELFQLARWRFIKAPDDIIPPNNGNWDIYDSRISMTDRSLSDPYRWNDPLKDASLHSPYFGGYLGDDFIDIDFEFIEGDVALPSIQKYIADSCDDTKLSKTTVAVCLPEASEAMSAALYFSPSVYENVQQIWVQQSESGALVDAVRYGLTGKDNAKFRTLRPFGMIDQCDYLTRIHNIMPKLVAYAYVCMDRNSSLAQEAKKLSPCELLREIEEIWLAISHDGGKSAIAKRWSNIYCANSFETKARAAGIDLSAKGIILKDEKVVKELAKVEHNRWVMEQLLLGIRPVSKDFEGKLPIEDKEVRKQLKAQNIHPDLISNEKLGSTQTYDEGIVKIIPLAFSIAKEYSRHDR